MIEDLISIIIPVYNQQKELQLALESIKKQTWKNLEVIIEEDKLHEGAPIMRNKGLAKSRGEYVVFWDADVVAESGMLEKMYQALQNNQEASYAYCNFQFPTKSCVATSLLYAISNFQKIFNFQKKIKSREFDDDALKKNNYIHSTSLIRRKDAIKWDESLNRFQDWDLWLTMAEQGKTGVWIDESLFKIISQGTMSRWLPSFAYKKPWKWLPGIKEKVKSYEQAKAIVAQKHHLQALG